MNTQPTKTRTFNGAEIAEIIADTVNESYKDLKHLEERRPLLCFVANLSFDIIADLASNNQVDLTPAKTRNLQRGAMLTKCLSKFPPLPPVQTTGIEG